ncbi:MAG: DUF3050 domain-containing protein [Rhodocyclaceae bacterium]|nr:DUF3050 domain-containing protein [Rhodocyclaceae bacterium]
MSTNSLPWHDLDDLRTRLNEHPVYGLLQTESDLRRFMSHHIYSVWDFMSLVKTLQAAVAPTRVPWVPLGDPSVRRFINEIVMEEESDLGLPESGGPEFLSHFELYCAAMGEVGSDPSRALAFVHLAASRPIAEALREGDVPEPARAFMGTTFGFIATGKPHLAAAALALGREHVIPAMFRRFLGKLGVTEEQAPMFHYYLKRHIHLDEDFHAPLSLRLLESLCAGDGEKLAEAHAAAEAALEARIRFWDGVAAAIAAR